MKPDAEIQSLRSMQCERGGEVRGSSRENLRQGDSKAGELGKGQSQMHNFSGIEGCTQGIITFPSCRFQEGCHMVSPVSLCDQAQPKATATRFIWRMTTTHNVSARLMLGSLWSLQDTCPLCSNNPSFPFLFLTNVTLGNQKALIKRRYSFRQSQFPMHPPYYSYFCKLKDQVAPVNRKIC